MRIILKALILLSLSVPCEAIERYSFTGPVVMENVQIVSHSKGSFEWKDGKNWIEKYKTGQILYRFVETKRNDDAIILKSLERHRIFVKLDLKRRMVQISTPSSNGYVDLYPMTDYSGPKEGSRNLWTLESLQNKCDQYSSNSQIKPYFLDLNCEKVIREWRSVETTVTLKNKEHWRVDAKGKSYPNEPLVELGDLYEDHNEIVELPCIDYQEHVELQKKSVRTSCDKIASWKSMNEIISACKNSELEWVSSGWAWEDMNSDERAEYPQLKPLKKGLCEVSHQ